MPRDPAAGGVEPVQHIFSGTSWLPAVTAEAQLLVVDDKQICQMKFMTVGSNTSVNEWHHILGTSIKRKLIKCAGQVAHAVLQVPTT